jgi:heavy metal sensor kinase
MRSIRLSLVAYFLLLLAVALGAVSIFAYQTTHQTLQAKQQARRNLLWAQYEDRCRKAEEQVEDKLSQQARNLATLAGYQTQWSHGRYQWLFSLGLISAAAGPHNHLTVPVWLAEVNHWRRTDNRSGRTFAGPVGPLAESVGLMIVTQIQLAEDDLPHAGREASEYIQINSEWGKEWRSRSLGTNRFAFDLRQFGATPLLLEKFDDTTLGSGVPLRRLTLKTPVAQTIGGFRFRPPTPPPADGSSRPTRPPDAHQTPTIFIQCAHDRRPLDACLAQFRTELGDNLTELEAESQLTLADLRRRMGLIGLTTFAATVLGGFWLVRAGLSPLRRLSEAVSRVSERDFRLQLEDRRMPRELQPIVERLTQTLELLQRAFAREKQAAADISHELRTPLAALLTTIEVALRKPRTPQEYRELLTDCLATGQQMSQLVERLLALARLDAGVDRMRPREVDVAGLAEQCAALVRPLAEARDLSLRFERNGPLPLVADPDKLREVLTNLLHNAIEYNRPHGSIELAVERHNGHVRLEVRDTGIGISPEAREHIFERFYRADPARQADGLHAGLGLAIVKGYIDLMGGTIAVDSTEGEGSTFRVTLPVS